MAASRHLSAVRNDEPASKLEGVIAEVSISCLTKEKQRGATKLKLGGCVQKTTPLVYATQHTFDTTS